MLQVRVRPSLLDFSRCSYYPFTHDCPWIWFDDKSQFITYEPASSGVQGNIAVPPPPVLCRTNDPEEAVAAAVANLPTFATTTWVAAPASPAIRTRDAGRAASSSHCGVWSAPAPRQTAARRDTPLPSLTAGPTTPVDVVSADRNEAAGGGR